MKRRRVWPRRSRHLLAAALAIGAAVGAALLGRPGEARAAGEPAAGEPAADAAKSLDEAAILGPPRGRPLGGAELDAATRALGGRMRCPVCQGLAITDSPSASALAMVAQVRELLARGYTEDQTLDYFVRSYGEFVLLQPTAKGWNLLVWLLPVGGVTAGATLIALRLRAARGRRDQDAAAAGSPVAGSSFAGERDLDRFVEQVRSEVRR